MSNYDVAVYDSGVYDTAVALVISNIQATNITPSAATITWTTNVVATSSVTYGLDTTYGTTTPTTDTSPRVLSHSVTISGLTNATLYHYIVASLDSGGVAFTSSDQTFTTQTIPRPVISNVAVGSIGTATATVTWTTDILSSSKVDYGPTSAYGFSTPLADTSPRVTSHSVVVSLNLNPAQTYHFRVRSIDASGNETVGTDNLFTTLAVALPPLARWPHLFVEVDFSGFAPIESTWTDISSYVRGLATRRGRSFELDRAEAGTLSLLLDNQARLFDSNNPSSPYYAVLTPMRRIRVRAIWGTNVYPIFMGFIEEWPQEWESNGRVAEVPLVASDGFTVFSLANLNEFHPSELAGNRITSVLNGIGWTSQRVSPGSTTIQASTIINVSALDHMNTVADSDNGLFFVDAQGRATFLDRTARITFPYNTSQATFGDANDGVEIPYSDLKLGTSPIYNEIRFTRVGGIEQVLTDATSQSQYYRRTRQETGLLQTTDSEVNIAAAWVLNRFSQPATRVISMTLDPGRNIGLLWPQALGREIGDRITIVRRPPGGGPAIVQESFIEGIDHTAAANQWQTVFRTSPASNTSYWILGDSISGKLGQTTRLSY